MLAELVERGELPPIEERLPLEPYVVGPGLLEGEGDLDWKPGIYGGVMRLAQEAASGDPNIFIGMNESLLWVPAGVDFAKGVHGSVLKGFDENEDSSEFTFYMREGLKWSDGVPVTTEDVRFAIEDVLMDEEITPIFPARYRSKFSPTGSPCQLTVIDDYTFKLTFDEPYGSFPAHLAISGWIGYADLLKPKHYLQQFHIKYTPLEDLQPLMEEASITEDQWYNLFNERQITGWMWNITNEAGMGHPVLTPWIIKKAEGGVFTYERNPYYFKVDTEGKQLPYIDGLQSFLVADRESLVMRSLTGEFDYPGERLSLKNLALMQEQADQGIIKLSLPRRHVDPVMYWFNYSYDDPAWREVTLDLRFRQALSMAINRQEIIDILYLGQFAQLPSELNPSEYDVDRANQLLDEMGLDEKDAEGFRLGPDGNRFEIRMDIQLAEENWLPIAELMAEYWNKVGIHTAVQVQDGTLLGQRSAANELHILAGWPHRPVWPYGNTGYVTMGSGTLWNQWYNTAGEAGEEPPEEFQEIYRLHEILASAPIGSAEAVEAYQAILDNFKENIWGFVPVEDPHTPIFFTPKIQNVKTGLSEGLSIIQMYAMEQWYMEE